MQLVQSKIATGRYDGTAGQQPKVIFDSTPLQGSLIIIILAYNSYAVNVLYNFDTNIVTNFTQIQEAIFGGARESSYYRITTSGAETKTYQATLDTANHDWILAAFEYRGFPSSPVDKIAPANGSAADTTSVTTGTTAATTQAHDFALAFITCRVYSTFVTSPTNGFTTLNNITSTTNDSLAVSLSILQKTLSTTGTQSTGGTTTSSPYAATLVTFKISDPFISPTNNIGATSSMSGSIKIPQKKLAAAAINATSTVTGGGAIQVVFFSAWLMPEIAGANIAATSSLAGTMITATGILPAAISATSTVTGNPLRMKRLLGTGAISATSTVSGRIVVKYRVVTTQINATSSMTGAVLRRAAVVGTNISATSTVSSAALKLKRAFPASVINAQSTFSGTILRKAAIIGNIAATSTLTGFIAKGGKPVVFPTSISAISVVSGIVSRKVATVAQIDATATVSGALPIRRFFVAGQISAPSTVSGVLRALRFINAAQIQAFSTLSGSFGVRRFFAANQINALVTISGTVRVLASLGGFINAPSTVSGRLPVLKFIDVSQIDATSTVSGITIGKKRLVPSVISASSDVHGNLSIKFLILFANIFATSAVAGEFDVFPVLPFKPVLLLSSEDPKPQLLSVEGGKAAF